MVQIADWSRCDTFRTPPLLIAQSKVGKELGCRSLFTPVSRCPILSMAARRISALSVAF
jgi:hypothetical protein